MVDHVYNKDFYDYIGRGSRSSARVVVPLVLANVQMSSILDVGAGNGAWLAVWREANVGDALAVDGAYVDTSRLAIPPETFSAHDLAEPLELGRKFDLIQSLEVAEHIPEFRSDIFVESLTRHGDVILFSAAAPNQGGEYHVNEQPPEYWRRKFARHGYACFDWLRPRLAGEREVKPWYRYNSLIFANQEGQARLSDAILSARIPEGWPVPLRGDFAWRMRRAAVSVIPSRGIHLIAMVKAAIEARSVGRSS